jgi:hypothetical protein
MLVVNPIYCQDWDLRLDTINSNHLYSEIYKSIILGYENEIDRVQKQCNSCSRTINNLNVWYKSYKKLYANLIDDKLNSTNEDELKKLLDIFLKHKPNTRIKTIYVIQFQHPKYESFEIDYFILYDAEEGWNIFNVNSEIRETFLKRDREGEFYWNFEWYFKNLKNRTNKDDEINDTIYCYAGRHSIMITKVFKTEMEDKEISYLTKFNQSTDCPEESFLEYILGFKNHLNPEKK